MTKARASSPKGHDFEFSGGSLCLDFANTLPDRPLCAGEHLRRYEDLLSWSRQAGLIEQDLSGRLAAIAGRHGARAEAALQRALELRECLHRVFSALGVGRQPTAKDLATLNRLLSEALPHLQISPRQHGFAWSWTGSSLTLDRMLWPVVRSAAELLTSSEASQVRECASEDCSWLFVDRSRTHRRRWCDMKTCGNRNKARRYYRRKKVSRRSKSPS